MCPYHLNDSTIHPNPHPWSAASLLALCFSGKAALECAELVRALFPRRGRTMDRKAGAGKLAGHRASTFDALQNYDFGALGFWPKYRGRPKYLSRSHGKPLGSTLRPGGSAMNSWLTISLIGNRRFISAMIPQRAWICGSV